MIRHVHVLGGRYLELDGPAWVILWHRLTGRKSWLLKTTLIYKHKESHD